MEDNKDKLVVIKRSELMLNLALHGFSHEAALIVINKATFPASEVFEAAFIDGVRYISSGIPIPDTVIKECYSIYEQTKL